MKHLKHPVIWISVGSILTALGIIAWIVFVYGADLMPKVDQFTIPWTWIFTTLFATAVSFIVAKYWFRKNQEVRSAYDRRNEAIARAEVLAVANAAHMERTAVIEKELSALKTAVVPISAAFQAILIKELTHYHTPVMDALMVKLGPPVTLTPAEERELAVALEERTRDMDGAISDSERDAAVMLPLVIKRVKAESLQTNPDVQLVAVPATGEKKE